MTLNAALGGRTPADVGVTCVGPTDLTYAMVRTASNAVTIRVADMTGRPIAQTNVDLVWRIDN